MYEYKNDYLYQCELLARIAQRYESACTKAHVRHDDRMTTMMDLEFAVDHFKDLEGEMNLEALIAFDDADLLHDVLGIKRAIDRESKTFEPCFLPRCYRSEVVKN